MSILLGPTSPGLAWCLCCNCQRAGIVLRRRKTFRVDGIQKVVFRDGRVSQIDGRTAGKECLNGRSEKMSVEERRLVDGHK